MVKKRKKKPSNRKQGWFIKELFDSKKNCYRTYNVFYKNGQITKKRLIKDVSTKKYDVRDIPKSKQGYEVYNTRTDKVVSRKFDRNSAIADSRKLNHNIHPETKAFI